MSGRNELDVAALERIVEHILSGGVHGLFVLGTTGEAPSLSDRLKEQVVERTVRLVNGRVSVLVGVSDTSLASSESLTRFAAECGADAVVLAPPSYFPLHQDDLLRYYAEFASEAPLPVVLYNIPSHARHVIALETVRQLLDVPNIVGLKDSAGDMLTYQRFVALVAQRPGFALLMGPEELLAESVLMGGHGGVCGGANLVPRLYVDLYEAAVTGDLRRVHQLQHQVLRISETLYRVGDPPSGYLTGLKCALSHMGLCSDRLAEPYHALRADKRAQIARHLQDLGLVSPHVGAGVGSGAGTVVAGSPRHNPTHKHTAEDGR